MVYIVSTTVFWLHGYAKTTNTAPDFDIFTLQNAQKYAIKHIFLANYLVVSKICRIFALCFSWY